MSHLELLQIYAIFYDLKMVFIGAGK